VIDPQTGRITYRPVDVGRTLPTPDFRGLGLPESVRGAAQDVPQTPITLRGTKVQGGPSPLESLGALNIPFQAAGDVAYQKTGSPLAGALTQAGAGMISPGAITRGAGALGRAARDVVPGALESLAGKMGAGPMYAVKPRGGQWLEPDLGDLLPHRQYGGISGDEIMAQFPGQRGQDIWNAYKQGPTADLHEFMQRNYPAEYDQVLGLTPGDKAISDYVNKNLRRWIKTSMGTEETDALAKELGIDYAQPGPRPGRGRLTYNANPFDAAIINEKAGDLAQSKLYAENLPWLGKTDPETDVYRLPALGDLPQPITQMMDYLRTVPPEKLKNISVPDALRQSKAYHDALAKKQTDEALQAGSLTTHREYPTGFKWQEIVAPKHETFTPETLPPGHKLEDNPISGWDIIDPTGNPMGYSRPYSQDALDAFSADYSRLMLEKGLDAEGKMMGHCVGSYCEEVSGRGTRIFSLRDPSGKPHVTVEVNPIDVGRNAKTLMSVDELNAADAIFKAQGWGKVGKNNWRKRMGRSWGDYITKDEELNVYQQVSPAVRNAMAQPLSEIRQIKGKQNAAPVEQYLPYVQDFVKNSPLGTPWGQVRDLQNAGLQKYGGRFVTQADIDAFHALPSNPSALPRDEYNQAFEEYMKNKEIAPEGHAKGGRIVPPEPELGVDVDPKTGRFIFGPKDVGRAAPLPTFRGLGLPEPIRRAAQDVPQTPMRLRGSQVTGGPTTGEAFGAMNIPFQAAGDVAYEQTGSPAVGALTQAGLGVASPGAITRGVGALGRATAEKLPGALESLASKAGAGPMYAVKPRGGQWIEPDLSSFDPLGGYAPREDAPVIPAQKAISDYVNKNLRRWIKTSMGTTETDDLARELGLINPNLNRGLNPFDAAVIKNPASTYQPKAGSEFAPSGILKENPWLSKMDPATDVYRLNPLAAMPGERDMYHQFDQMMDYLRTQPPERIKNISVPDALRQSKEWHDALAKKQTDEAITAGTLTTHREYPTGFKWQEIVSPKELPESFAPAQNADGSWSVVKPDGSKMDIAAKDPQLREYVEKVYTAPSKQELLTEATRRLTEEGLDAEGKMMGHCVGSYCEEVSGGGARIFSLRDPQGKPHVTVEVQPSEENVPLRRLFRQMPEEEQMHWLRKYELDSAKDPSLENISPAQYWSQQTGHGLDIPEPGGIIHQIKGKENAAPVEQYLPYVQDFVKNSPLGVPWSDVHELENASLMRLTPGHYVTKEEYLNHPSVVADELAYHGIGDINMLRPHSQGYENPHTGEIHRAEDVERWKRVMGQEPQGHATIPAATPEIGQPLTIGETPDVRDPFAPSLASQQAMREMDARGIQALDFYRPWTQEVTPQGGHLHPRTGELISSEDMARLRRDYMGEEPEGHAAGGHIQAQHVADFVNFLNAPEQ
jgi:hypothetical protein